MRILGRAAWAILCVLALVPSVWAHEVHPTIGDLAHTRGTLTLDLSLNVEAFVVGVDLDALQDINAAPEAEAYDEIRALTAERLAERFAPVAAQMAQDILVTTEDGAILPLAFAGAEIGPVGDIEALRESTARFVVEMAESVTSVRLTWPSGYGTLILRQIGVEGGYTGFVDGGTTSDAIPIPGWTPRAAWASFLDYMPVGFDRILPQGLDHILFMLGLFFLSLRLGALAWQVIAFSLGHSLTLALSALGWASPPSGVIAAIIAASLVYVAVDNILSPDMSRLRLVLVFGFGLAHGFGLAMALGAFGLPVAQFVPALIGFTLGVELGLLTVIAIAYLLVGHWFGEKLWYRPMIARPVSAVIGLIGAYWLIEGVLL